MVLLEQLKSIRNNPNTDSVEKLITFYEDYEKQMYDLLTHKNPQMRFAGREGIMFLSIDIETGEHKLDDMIKFIDSQNG